MWGGCPRWLTRVWPAADADHWRGAQLGCQAGPCLHMASPCCLGSSQLGDWVLRDQHKVTHTGDLYSWKLQSFSWPSLGSPRVSLPLSSIKLVPPARPGSEENWTPPLDVRSSMCLQEGWNWWQASWRLSITSFLEESPQLPSPTGYCMLFTASIFSQLTFTTTHIKIGILFSPY